MSSTTAVPLVSIIIPCYRQGQYLATAIDSALTQSHPRVEVIVVNDGSDDDTAAVAGRYGNRIHYIYRSNGGLSAARNTGIAQAQGTHLKFLDADDHLHPDQVAWHLEAMAGRLDRVSVTGVRMYRDGMPDQFEDHTPTVGHLIPFLLRDDDHWLPPIAYLVPTELGRTLGFDESLSQLEDWDFFSRLGLHDPEVVSDPRIGAYYRVRPGSMSANRLAMARSRGRLLISFHDLLRQRGRPDWFGLDLLKAEQGSYQQLIALGVEEPQVLDGLLARIKELQRRVGFGQFGWRFRTLALLVGYARAERIRSRVVKWLGIRPAASLDTGAWREKK
jgi:glycosyltransferase involved in cell wall biosynthesis